jgi:hypothetical protein
MTPRASRRLFGTGIPQPRRHYIWVRLVSLGSVTKEPLSPGGNSSRIEFWFAKIHRLRFFHRRDHAAHHAAANGQRRDPRTKAREVIKICRRRWRAA